MADNVAALGDGVENMKLEEKDKVRNTNFLKIHDN